MSLVEDSLLSSVGPAPVRRWRWTRQAYDRATELGVFGPHERLELIGGEVLERMSPQQSRHATGIVLAHAALQRAFRSGHVVRVQLPLALGCKGRDSSRGARNRNATCLGIGVGTSWAERP